MLSAKSRADVGEKYLREVTAVKNADWNTFWKTGSIEAYLKWKTQKARQKKEEKQNVFAAPKPAQEPPKNKTVYISAFEEDAQKKPKGHFDYVTGRRVSQTVKERTQDM